MGLNSHDPDTPQDSFLLRNNPAKSWIVQKFGGTSVGKFANQIAQDIVRPGLRDNRIAVVCSARSSHSKGEGTTNRLLRAAREAEHHNSRGYGDIVASVRDEHIEAAKDHIKSESILPYLVADIEEECRDLTAFLAAAQKVGEVSSRTVNNIISKGEILSGRFMTALLQDRGIDAQFVNLSTIIDFKTPRVLGQDFYRKVAFNLQQKIVACGEKVPVVTGYFGMVQGGLLDQIGRGYTDLCAALIAMGLGAEELQVWKEVDGIFTADPRKVPTAELLPTISPAEAAELTFYGSEVIHPFTMERVIQARILIRIKNVMNPRGLGTVIVPDPIGVASTSAPGYDSKLSSSQRPKRPTAVTIKRNILVVDVYSDQRSLSYDFFPKIFSVLQKWRLTVDLISTSRVHVSMVLPSESALVSEGGEDEKKIVDQDLRGAVEELGQYGTVNIDDSMAIVSLVGKEMRDMNGIAGKMFSTLGKNRVNMKMISQGMGISLNIRSGKVWLISGNLGANEINISCVIEKRDADRAINILHTSLFTFPDQF
ncbi:Aspartokinase [Lambiella insularis]|nr:Aspartokinase [Lambiella insularis]